jgi:TPR repeat protein
MHLLSSTHFESSEEIRDGLKNAADQGSVDVQFDYGIGQQTDEGISIDLNETASYFKLAADQGDVFAQRNYGVCPSNGGGVSRYLESATHYFTFAFLHIRRIRGQEDDELY